MKGIWSYNAYVINQKSHIVIQNDERLFLIDKKGTEQCTKCTKKEMGGSKNEKKDFGSFIGVHNGTFFDGLQWRF